MSLNSCNSTGWLSNSTNSSVTSGRFSPFIRPGPEFVTLRGHYSATHSSSAPDWLMNTDDGSDPLSSLAHSGFFLFPKEFCSRLGERDRDLEQDLRHSSVGVQRTPGGGIWTAPFRSLNSALSLKLSAFMMMDVCKRHVLQLSTSQELLFSSSFCRDVKSFLVWPSAVCCLLSSSCELLTAGFKVKQTQSPAVSCTCIWSSLPPLNAISAYVCCQLCLQCKELYHHRSTLKDLDRRAK